jgi:hypothetical protein
MKKVFLDKNSHFTIVEKLDVIISPSLYWSRVFEIPVKREGDAIKYLPSLYEEVLPAGEYSYHIKMLEEGKFITYAYNKKMISRYILKSGLTLSQVQGVYFAGNELYSFLPLRLDTKSVLIEQNSVVLKAPSFCVNECENVEDILPTLILSKDKIRLDNYMDLVESPLFFKSALKLGILLLAILFISIVNKQYLLNELVKQKEDFIAKNSLPSSSIQIRSIVDNYNKGIKPTKVIREKLLDVISKNITVESITLDQQQLRIVSKKDISKRFNTTAKLLQDKRYEMSINYGQ